MLRWKGYKFYRQSGGQYYEAYYPSEGTFRNWIKGFKELKKDYKSGKLPLFDFLAMLIEQ